MNQPSLGQPLPRHNSHLPVPYQGHEMAVHNPYTQPEWVDNEIDLRHLWRIISKYRWLIISVFAACAVTALIASMLVRPVYRATSLIEVKPSQRVVKFDNLQQSDLKDREFLNTQVNILRSESVAEAVIQKAELADDPEFNGELNQRGLTAGIGVIKVGLSSAVASVTNGFSENPNTMEPAVATDYIPPEVRRKREFIQRYQGKLTVEEVPTSDLLRVSFDSYSPVKSAELANAHTQAYIESSNVRRFNSTSSAKEFLQQQIRQTQANLETSEQALTDFAREHNIVDVEDRNNVIETRLVDLSSNLTRTRQERINAEVAYLQAQEGDIASLPVVLEGVLIRELNQQYATLQSEYREMSSTFKGTYPKLQRLKSKMENVKESLDGESRKLVVGLKNRYEQLVSQEQKLDEQVDAQQSKLLDLKDRAISYNILKREWEANKELYAGLLEKQKDVSVSTGMERNNISVVDRAAVPVTRHTPQTTWNVAIAGVFGLTGGVGIAFLLAFLDNTFRNREDLEQALGLTFLGLLPKNLPETNNELVPLPLLSQYEPGSRLAEAIRSIRTNVLFSRPEHVPKKILITSTTSGEGKTTIATNLALVMAQNGSRVLIMEADLRRPNIAKWMNVEPTPGLTEYLSGNTTNIVKATPYENVYCIPAGRVHSNPAELLGSRAMDDYLKSLLVHFDFIILDGPPILGLADSMILSAKVDGVLMVVKAASTGKDAVAETVKRLRTINAPVIGSILNYVDLSQREYGYYQNYYYGYGDHKDQRVSDRSDGVRFDEA